MTSLELVTPPEVEPVSVAEMKAHARIDTDADDALIGALITAARQWAEGYTRRAFITQTLRYWLDEGPDRHYLELPRPPLAVINNVKTYDDNNDASIWNAANYFADTSREPGRLALRGGAVWPCEERFINNMAIEYDAGYGAEPDDVPEVIRLAIKQLASHWYEHRGEAVMLSAQNTEYVPLILQALLNPFRVQRLGVRG